MPSVEGKVDYLIAEFALLKIRLDKLETMYKEWLDVAIFSKRLDELDTKLDSLSIWKAQKRYDEKFDSLEASNKIHEKAEEMFDKEIKEEFQSITSRLDSIEANLSAPTFDLYSNVKELEASIKELGNAQDEMWEHVKINTSRLDELSKDMTKIAEWVDDLQTNDNTMKSVLLDESGVIDLLEYIALRVTDFGSRNELHEACEKLRKSLGREKTVSLTGSVIRAALKKANENIKEQSDTLIEKGKEFMANFPVMSKYPEKATPAECTFPYCEGVKCGWNDEPYENCPKYIEANKPAEAESEDWQYENVLYNPENNKWYKIRIDYKTSDVDIYIDGVKLQQRLDGKPEEEQNG